MSLLRLPVLAALGAAGAIWASSSPDAGAAGPSPHDSAPWDCESTFNLPDKRRPFFGWGHDAEPGAASAKAEAQASEAARRWVEGQPVCSDLRSPACWLASKGTGVPQAAPPRKVRVGLRTGWSTCAVVTASNDAGDAAQRDAADLTTNWSAMAQRVRHALENSGRRTVLRVGRFRFAGSGCPAGDVEASLRTPLDNALASAGFALAAFDDALVPRLDIGLSVAVGEVHFGAALDLPDRCEGGLPVEGFTMRAELLGLRDGEGGDCGVAVLPQGAGRVGRDGDKCLAARLEMERGWFCHGDRTRPVLNLSGPARVQVFDVQPDGRAVRFLPVEEHGWSGVHGWRVALDEGEAGWDPDVPGVRLVAVALPEGKEPTGPSARWVGECLVPRFEPGLFPASAAIAEVAFDVLGPDDRRCARSPAVAPRVQDELAQMPLCGGP